MPLLGGVILNKGVEKWLTDEGDSLFGEILRIFGGAGSLFRDFGFGLVGGVGGMEELVDGAEVDGHRIDFALVSDVYFMNVVGKSSEAIDVLPNLLV